MLLRGLAAVDDCRGRVSGQLIVLISFEPTLRTDLPCLVVSSVFAITYDLGPSCWLV